MTEWTNPYPELQRALRQAINDGLRRTNGLIDPGDFANCVVPGAQDKAAKMLLRLLLRHPDGRLEWKPELVSEAALLDKLGGSKAVDVRALTRLFEDSRRLANRTSYPSIAPVANKSQLVSRHSFLEPPVFGVDILVRPPTEFSDDRDDGELRNALTLGDEALALVVHGEFDGLRLVTTDTYVVRLVVGNAFSIPRIVGLIPRAAFGCEQALREPLLAGDPQRAVAAVLPHLNRFAADAALAFVS